MSLETGKLQKNQVLMRTADTRRGFACSNYRVRELGSKAMVDLKGLELKFPLRKNCCNEKKLHSKRVQTEQDRDNREEVGKV